MAVNQVSTNYNEARPAKVYKLAGRSKIDQQALKDNWEDIKASAKDDLIEESKKNGYYRDSNSVYKDGVVYERSNATVSNSDRSSAVSPAKAPAVENKGVLVQDYSRDNGIKQDYSSRNELRENRNVLEQLSQKFKNVSFAGGGAGRLRGNKEYSVILSDEEMDILKNGSDEEKEKMYKTIEDSLKELSDMKEKIKGNDMFGKFSFGLSINTKAGTNESIVSFLAQSGDKSYSAGSTDELIKLISGSKPVDYRV